MTKQQKITIKIPYGYTREQRESIAYDIIDRIVFRTTELSRDKEGSRFTPYSKSYAKEKGQRKVDLVQGGDMMMGLTLLTHRSGAITIGYEADSNLNGKVEGNRLGTYGKSSPVTQGRDFLGITEDELSKILDNYPQNERMIREGQIEEDIFNQASVMSDSTYQYLQRQEFLNSLGLNDGR